MKIRFVMILTTGALLLSISSPSYAESYYVKPIGFVTAVTQVAKVIANMSFISSSLKDVEDGKTPPARSPTWQAVISDAEALATSIRNSNFLSHQPGDMSIEAQNDCTRYEGVLVAFRKHYEDLQDTQKELPPILTELNDLKGKLAAGVESADSLMKTYAHLSASPVPAVRDFFAWATYDMINVSKALNSAKSEVDNKLSRIGKGAANLPERITQGKANVEAYEKRMPVMRDYCSRRK
jgi:ABC-type transporter Mla subunit MlaD